MVLHPEVLAKAQREMDDVIGIGRLPTIEDRPSLPYLDCILKETWRYVISTKMRHCILTDAPNGMQLGQPGSFELVYVPVSAYVY